MTLEQIIALARDAGSIDSEETIATVAAAVIAAHTEELMQGAGDPVAFVVALPGRPISMTVPVAHLDRLVAMHNEPLYTAEQVAAAVSKAMQDAHDNRVMAHGLYEQRISDYQERIATLESTLKVALEVMDELMEFQVKHMKVWNNPAYDIAHMVDVYYGPTHPDGRPHGHVYKDKGLGASVPIYSAAQVAAAVAHERHHSDHTEIRDRLHKRIATLESTLKVALEALEPHKSTVLRWYTPVDHAIAQIKEVLHG